MLASLYRLFCRVFGHSDLAHENGLVTVRCCTRCRSLRVTVEGTHPVCVNLFWFTFSPDEEPSGLPTVVLARQLPLPNETQQVPNG